jgi:hypothetical protein
VIRLLGIGVSAPVSLVTPDARVSNVGFEINFGAQSGAVLGAGVKTEVRGALLALLALSALACMFTPTSRRSVAKMVINLLFIKFFIFLLSLLDGKGASW